MIFATSHMRAQRAAKTVGWLLPRPPNRSVSKGLIVQRFRYIDRDGNLVLADDYATARAIQDICGIPEPGTAMEVDHSRVSPVSGFLIKGDA
jgi:hypothetical protein